MSCVVYWRDAPGERKNRGRATRGRGRYNTSRRHVWSCRVVSDGTTWCVRCLATKTFYFCFIFQKENNKRQLRLRNGLMTQHAYSVTGLARVRGPLGDTPLVRLRNPWGEGEWTGPWSERSWEWDGLSHRDKELLSVRVRNDGEFWWVVFDWPNSIGSWAELELKVDGGKTLGVEYCK